MSNAAIRITNLGKHFRIGARQERYSTLRDKIASMAAAPLRRFRRNARQKRVEETTIWALRHLDVEIEEGDVVGIVGRNGAGKSTLLKILSRITEPSEGRAEVRGRVGSLLEVGTGFHLELTGRENIYLNGAILGMRRAEIDRKFDEIVAFSGVEKFIDTAVKHYSSGMYLRLAFAVAAHLEPEILLVDEVLAVGDAAFQKKCIGKMNDVAAQGRTVLFVSHNMGAVKELCRTGLVLINGKADFCGSVTDAIGRYSRSLDSNEDAVAGGSPWRGIDVNDNTRKLSLEVRRDEPVTAKAQLYLRDEYPSGHLIFLIEGAMGDTIINHRVQIGSPHCGELACGANQIEVNLPPLWLAPGVYTAYFKFLGQNSAGRQERHLSDRALFEVPGSVGDLGRAVLAPSCQWNVVSNGHSVAAVRTEKSL
jgi:lipopolysaccharide transport system ATP-binding protein